MPEEIVYGIYSAIPCGHKLDPECEQAPKLLFKPDRNTGVFKCPFCPKEQRLLINETIEDFDKQWKSKFLSNLEGIGSKVDNKGMLVQHHEPWNPPTIQKLMRKPPTEEEERKHEEIKATLPEKQQVATDIIKEELRKRSADFLLCEDKLIDTEPDDILKFMMSDYAKQGSTEFQQRKREAIPVLRLTRADFDESWDLEYTGKPGKLTRKTKAKLNYFEPGRDWFRVGLKVRGRYENDDWIDSEDPEKAWTVAYHGSTALGNQCIAEDREFLTDRDGQKFRASEDVNIFSSRFGEECGEGAYFSNFFGEARIYADKAENGETCVFEVHLNPKEMRIPGKQPKYAIINDHLHARPTGICIKRSVEEPKNCQLM